MPDPTDYPREEDADELRERRSNFGIKAGLVALLLAGTTALYSISMPEIKGTEDHTRVRVQQYEEANERYRRTHHGQDAPWYKTPEQVVRKVSGERESGKDAATYGMAALGLAAIIAGAYALIKK